MRLFIALNFSEKIKASVAAIRDRLKADALRGNFSSDENLHLTLVFLGECNPQQINVIKTLMGKVDFSDFTLSFHKTGYFKSDVGNTWWIGLKDSKPLSNLQADLCNSLEEKGFIVEKRSYAPHITIGREVKMQPGYKQPDTQQVDFKVKSIELMKSERINGKLTYTPVFSKKSIHSTNHYAM